MSAVPRVRPRAASAAIVATAVEERGREREEREERRGRRERAARPHRGADDAAREEQREQREDERGCAERRRGRRIGSAPLDPDGGEREGRRERRGEERAELAELVPGRVEERQRSGRDPRREEERPCRADGATAPERGGDLEEARLNAIDLAGASYPRAPAPG